MISVTLTLESLLVPESTNLLGFSGTTVSRDCRENIQFYRQKCVVNERGQRRARLVEADRKVIIMQITMIHNSGMQKSISEHTVQCVKPLSG